MRARVIRTGLVTKMVVVALFQRSLQIMKLRKKCFDTLELD